MHWAVWCAARPGLADALGLDPLDDACAALTAGHPHWVRLWHALGAAYPDETKVLEIGADWVAEPRHFTAPHWSVLWESLLDADWRAFADARGPRDALIALGRTWLHGQEQLPDWNYVWQLLLEHRAELPAEIDAATLYRAGAQWLESRELEDTWSFIWQTLWEQRQALRMEAESGDLLQAVSRWLLLPQNRKRGEWDKLFETALDAGAASEELQRAGADWIYTNQGQPQVPILIQKLLALASPSADWADMPAGLLADWLTTNGDQRVSNTVLHFILKSGIASDPGESSDVPTVGWQRLTDTLKELTAAPRAFIAEHAFGAVVTGKIVAHAKKGNLVHLNQSGQVTAFLPGSQLDLTRPTDWEAPVGTSSDMEIIKVDPESLSIMVSRRAVLEHERRAAGGDPIEALAVGQTIEGTIANVVDYGLFVDVGGINGLLHRFKLVDPPRGDLAKRYEIGQKIRIDVIQVDNERNRVSLAEFIDPAEKQAREDAKLRLIDSLHTDQVLDGTVHNIVDYGLFVDLGGMDGLLHRSNLTDSLGGDLALRYNKDEPIRVEIIEIDRERERVGLAERSPPDASEFEKR